jgi:zinc transport system ATP-binding protein
MKIVVMSSEGSPSPADAVDVAALVVRYAGRPVLHGVSTGIRTGSLTVVLGPNGSGKSTLVRAAVGLIPLAAGEVRLFGTPLTRFRDWHRIGYVPQRTTAATGVPATVREVVTSGRLAGKPWWRAMGAADRAGVAAALETVGLADRAGDSVATLSGGQQQRVLIARALAGRPDLLIMDEPMAGVDFAHQEDFARTVALLAAEGRTVVLVAHELGALEPLVDRTLVLRGGHLLYDGPPPSADSAAGGLVAQDPHGHAHGVLTPHQAPARWW